jgi:hypothetical protein
MDGAVADGLYTTNGLGCMARCVGGRGARGEGLGVSPARAGASADLGGSSKYSNENFED